MTTIWDHLEELKRRLKVILISLLASTAFFMIFPADPADFFNAILTGMYRPAVSLALIWIKDYIAPKGLQIISLEIGAPLGVYFTASFLFGFIVSSPIIAYELFKFIDPALYPNERRAVYPFVTAFTVLFIVGAAFGLFLLAPFITYTLIIFSQVVGSQPVLSVMDFYSMTFATVLYTGIGFTTPAIFLLLVRLGIAKTSMITKNRVYVYFIVYVATAFITPDGGPLADFALFIPLMAMLEITILIAKRYERRAKDSAITGEVVETSKKCKFCGSRMGNNKIFCPKCGKSQS